MVAWLVFRSREGHGLLAMEHPWPRVTWWTFFFCLGAFFVGSTAFIITLGNHVLVDIPIPGRIESTMDIFRWVGRFIWPVATGLLFLALLGTCRLPRWLAAIILSLALVLQFIDVNIYAHNELQWRQATTEVPRKLFDERWDEIVSRHLGISVIPFPFKRFESQEYDLGFLAYRHQIKIDASYYARYPAPEKLEPMWQRFHDFWRGRPDSSWLYIVHEDMLKRKNLHAWKTLLPMQPDLLLLDNYYVASFVPGRSNKDILNEWPIEQLSKDWEVLSVGSHSFNEMGDTFDSLFLGGFESSPEGARLSHDLGVMAFRIPSPAKFLKFTFIPSNQSSKHQFLVKGELLSDGVVIANQEIQPSLGWSECDLSFPDVPPGDYILRLSVQFFHQKSKEWRPRKASSVIMVKADVF